MDLLAIKEWGGYVGMALLIGLYFLFPARKRELDEATKKLVATLKDTVDILEREQNLTKIKLKETTELVLELQIQQQENVSEIERLNTEKQTIKEILEARDKNTQSFQEQCLDSIKVTTQTYELIKSLVESMKIMVDGLSRNNEMTSSTVEVINKHFK